MRMRNKVTDGEINDMLHLRACGLSLRDIAKETGRSTRSVDNYVRIYRDEIEEMREEYLGYLHQRAGYAARSRD